MTPQRQGNNRWQSAVSSTSPKLANAMDVAMAVGAEASRVSRRILQKIWDPEPINDRDSNEPVWCLGRSYTLGANGSGTPSPFITGTPPADGTVDTATTTKAAAPAPIATPGVTKQQVIDTPPDSLASSFDSSLAYEDPSQDSGWPPAFLDDFESRIWMTYRTGFEVIPRSTDPKAASALSFAMRLKTSFGDQTGFSSDTGWGCMIRSGQSLLANALLISRLGRGKLPSTHAPKLCKLMCDC
jgi:cysteine protease ATG4